jgi:hypothetical protein
MSASDQELEALDAWLDGAGEAPSAPPELLTQLRGERAARAAVWASLEPSDAEVDRFVDRIASQIRRDGMRRQVRGPWRFAAAVAACAAIGFSGGWLLRGKQPAGHIVAASQSHVAPGVEAVVTYQVALTDEKGRVTAVQNFDSLEQAREFTRDLGQWQERQRQLRDGAAVIVADQY